MINGLMKKDYEKYITNNSEMKKDILKIEFGILPADDFTNRGIEKSMIEQIENSKIDNCYIDNTISKINSIDNNNIKYYDTGKMINPDTSHLFTCGKIGETTVAYYLNKDWLKSPTKKKRKRKPKIRKRHSF